MIGLRQTASKNDKVVLGSVCHRSYIRAFAFAFSFLVQQFDAQCETAEEQFELVIFLDGQERRTQAVEASLAAFRESWRRPKWHVFVQE